MSRDEARAPNPFVERDSAETEAPSADHGPAERRTPDADTAVAELIQLAGKRPSIPSDHAAIVKEAALAQWQETVIGERRRRFAWQVGGLLAAAALLFSIWNTGWLDLGSTTSAPEPMASLELVIGSVRSTKMAAGKSEPGGLALLPGAAIPSGSGLETHGSDGQPSRASLLLADGTRVRLDVDTRIHLLGPSVIRLDSGAVYVDTEVRGNSENGRAAPDDAGRSIEVRTDHGVIRDIGTRFEVRTEAENSLLRVRVRDGAILLDRENEKHIAEAGEQVAIAVDGTVSESAIAPGDPSWSWTWAILPPFTVEGRSLRECLEWTAYEGGWQLDLADPTSRDLAETSIIYGSIDGLGLEDAIELCLFGSGLAHEIESGRLVIETAPESGSDQS